MKQGVCATVSGHSQTSDTNNEMFNTIHVHVNHHDNSYHSTNCCLGRQWMEHWKSVKGINNVSSKE